MLNRKQLLREEIWNRMEREGIAIFPLPCRGRIPNFKGARAAAERLCLLPDWKKAKAIFVNPDSPQRSVREYVLKDGKTLIVASPRLEKGILLISPDKAEGKEYLASTIKGAFRFGVEVEDFAKPDLVVEGSVAVDKWGHRLGKGHGYGDKEVRALKRRFGEILVATTVHDMQIVEEVPHDERDEKIGIIVTPTRLIHVQ